jgi:hypothetical protein
MSDEKQAKSKDAKKSRVRSLVRHGGLGMTARRESADGQMLSVTHYLISAIGSLR